MKFTISEIILSSCLILLLTFTVNQNKEINPSFSNLSFLQSYIQKIVPAGEEIVILFTSGAVYNSDRQPIYFIDKTYIETIQRELVEKDYTFISINTLCLADNPECIHEFTDLAVSISKLNPKAVIYKGIDNGLANRDFKKILKSEDIPIYIYGTELIIDYEVYAGPDNIELGRYAFESVEKYIEPSQSAVYIETLRGVGTSTPSKYENGFPRINSVRNLMTNAGVKEATTLFTQWSEGKTYRDLIDYLQINPTPNYIFVPSGETAVGAVNAVETLELQDQVKIVALDFTEDIKTLIEEGRLYAAVSQKMKKQIEYLVNELDNNNKEKGPHKKLFAGPYITKEVLETADIDKLY